MVPTYGVFIDSTADLYRQAEILGRIIGNESRAARVVGIMTEYEKKVTNVTSSMNDTDPKFPKI